jgi:hypothetical protein
MRRRRAEALAPSGVSARKRNCDALSAAMREVVVMQDR